MNAGSETRCYALRRLNPFLGVVEVVETTFGRATSTNGLVWDIQLLTEVSADWVWPPSAAFRRSPNWSRK